MSAMLSPAHVVGRIALVTDSESSLSNEYVTIEGYDDKATAFKVRQVNPKSGIVVDDGIVGSLVKNRLQLVTGDEFTHRFPKARIVQGTTAILEVKHGSLVDFSKVPLTPTYSWGCDPMVIKGSCRVVGKADAGSGLFRKLDNCIKRRVIIDAANDNDIVEFESVFFQRDGAVGNNSHVITCKRGKIQFRNCYFVDCADAILMDGSAQVMMESCFFKKVSRYSNFAYNRRSTYG